MAIKIRLTRIGRHKDPIYRIVVADSRFPRDGRYIEQIGYFDPSKSYKDADLDVEKTLNWLKSGAQYSDSIKALLVEKGVLEKAKGTCKSAKKSTTKKKHDFSKKKAPSHPKKEVFHPQPRKKEEAPADATTAAPEANATPAPEQVPVNNESAPAETPAEEKKE